ncbi:patatin-like phospholipase family protein [Undibacterium sp. CY18W]|uniref:Patatin-like phospholipase family protein n=1 Tax=Undibacterium hunanense TaxID=2762292 RepID=A0ABR6ZST0_9BURK|nr:patatin-like phospholipase family protein [Undibacterium hunanense]MBC3918956.1 patatin-like phospholipase family protein [Undibacterium hunanense]
MNQVKKYKRCMVLAGGGFRFGIYLGMYAAAVEAGRAPDILLASCGGALAASIIAGLPDDAQRKAWLSSKDMYHYWGGLTSSPRAGIVRTLAMAAKRGFIRDSATVIPDLFNEYLFEIPPRLPLPEVAAGEQSVATAIIGGKLLFDESEAGQLRGQRKLFAETVFCEPRAASLLAGMPSPLADPRWGEHAISDELLCDVNTPTSLAARISITDMFYFRCHAHTDGNYFGGVLDLFPIEVARALADEVMMEFKQSFDQAFSIPAWRTVLGLDGNARLRYVNGQPVDVRIDTSDVATVLDKEAVQKKLDWLQNRISLQIPKDYATYVAYMDAQWQYGYTRGMEAFTRQTAYDEAHIRNSDKYSRGCA